MRHPIIVSVSAFTALVVLLLGCGGSDSSTIAEPTGDGGGGGGGSGTGTKSGSDGGSGGGNGGNDGGGGGKDGASDIGPFQCGSTDTCTGTQYCLTPCCGGPAPFCGPKPASGTCPAGTHAASCPNSESGCEADPCVPSPPHCVDSNAITPDGCTKNNATHSYTCVCA